MYKKPDLVKGEHHYRVFSVAPGRGVSDMDLTEQLDDYRQATGWKPQMRVRDTLWIVALHPTVGILDSGHPHPSQFMHERTAWNMSDELSLVMLESDRPPERLVLEQTADGRCAIIDMPWGHLLVLPEEGVVLGVE